MKEIIAMHGWGGDSQTWEAWKKSFQSKNWIWTSLDRGYGKIQARFANWNEFTCSETIPKRVIICHSLGLHLVQKHLLKEATHIVLLSSFGRFLPEGNQSRSLKIALKGMKQAIGSSEEKEMLINFLQKACNLNSINNLPDGPIKNGLSSHGRKQLEADLNLLMHTSGLPEDFPLQAKVLTIYGKEDKIIHPQSKMWLINELNNKLQNQPLHWVIPKQGHSIFMPKLIQQTQTWLELA